MNKEKQIMDEFEIYESLIRKNANQKYIDCQMDRVIETIKKSQREEIVEEIEIGIDEIFSKRKEVCTCPKGGMYGDEVCSDCGGTEWALSKELKEIGQEIKNLITKEDDQ